MSPCRSVVVLEPQSFTTSEGACKGPDQRRLKSKHRQHGNTTRYTHRRYIARPEADLLGRLTHKSGCSGSTTDRRNAMALLASNYENDPIDVLVGDWMSEANMTARANVKLNGMNAVLTLS